jgi:pimeloyl-ACP methyl ester carboxylesterase
MFFAPLPFVVTWLASLASLVVLGGGLYLLWAWYVGILVGTGYLVAGLLLTLWSFLGRFLVLAFHHAGPDEPHALEPQSEARVTRPDGTTLYVERYGPPTAPTLLLTHGAGANRTSWYYVIRALREHFQVMVWDMPGLGHSHQPKDGDYSLERHARDLRAVLELIPDQPVVLAGHSMGGMVLLTLCRLFPEELARRVRGLVLVDTSFTNPARTTTAAGLIERIQKPVLEPLLHLTAWLAPLFWLLAWLGYLNGSSHLIGMFFGFAGSQTRGQLDLAARYNPLAWPGVQAHETLAMFGYDATPTLPSIMVPSLVITGNVDRLIVPETARRMSERLPHARLVRLEPAGHMSVFERHDRLVSALREFADATLSDGSQSDGQATLAHVLRDSSIRGA